MNLLYLYLTFLLFTCAPKEELAIATPDGDTTTIILVRHAEKMDKSANPALSAVGMERAKRLHEVLKEYKPDAFYSTNYLRTMQTLEPWAEKSGQTIKHYNPRQPDSLVALLKKEAGKTVVVAGHSNTVPALVNKLIGQQKYEDLADTEYGKIFIVRIEDELANVELRNY